MCGSCRSSIVAGTSTPTWRAILPNQCRDIDQPAYALIQDLKQRGLLDDTLVVWGGEFGRTVYCQGNLTRENYGRDHHPRCFTIWMAGGGIKPGIVYGETDDFSYNIVENPVHIHDMNATILHCLGIDHRRLSVKYQGLDVRLTGVEDQHPVEGSWPEQGCVLLGTVTAGQSNSNMSFLILAAAPIAHRCGFIARSSGRTPLVNLPNPKGVGS